MAFSVPQFPPAVMWDEQLLDGAAPCKGRQPFIPRYTGCFCSSPPRNSLIFSLQSRCPSNGVWRDVEGPGDACGLQAGAEMKKEVSCSWDIRSLHPAAASSLLPPQPGTGVCWSRFLWTCKTGCVHRREMFTANQAGW